MPASIQAVIFDVDGVMIDSEGNQSISYEKVLREHGAEPELNENGIVQIVGIRAPDNLKRLKNKHNLAASIEDLLARKNEIYEELLKEHIIVQPGLLELIGKLKNLPVKKAIGSSGQKHLIDIVVNHLGLQDYFEAIVSGDDVKAGKPAPDIYLEVARRIGVAPENCVVLEDAGDGVLAAKAAGMKVIAIPNTYTKTHDFDSADLVVGSLEELSWDKIKSL